MSNHNHPPGVRVGARYRLQHQDPQFNGLIVEVTGFFDEVNHRTGYVDVLARDDAGRNYKVRSSYLARIVDIPRSGHGLALLPTELQDIIIKESGIFTVEGSRSWLGGNMADVPQKGWKDWAQQYIPTVAATEPDFVTRSIVLEVWEFFRDRNMNPWPRQLRNEQLFSDQGRVVAGPNKYTRRVDIRKVNGEHVRVPVYGMERRNPVFGPNGYAHEYDNNYAELETGAEFPRRLYALP